MILTADVRIAVKMTARRGAARQPKIANLEGFLGKQPADRGSQGLA